MHFWKMQEISFYTPCNNPATKLRGYYVFVPSVRLSVRPSVRPSVRLSVTPSAKRRHRSSIFVFGPISKIFHRFTLLVMNLIKFDFGWNRTNVKVTTDNYINKFRCLSKWRRHRSSIFVFGPISKIFHRFTLLGMILIKLDFGWNRTNVKVTTDNYINKFRCLSKWRRHRSSIFVFGLISKIFHRFTLLVMNLIKFNFG